MTLRRLALALAALVAAPLSPAAAQRGGGLQIGAPLRVIGLDVPGGQVTGVFAGVVGDTVLIGVTDGIEAVRVPRRAITHLQVLFGRRSGAARVSVQGMLVGSAAAAAAVFVFRNRLDPGVGGGIIVAGGAGGLMVGGLVGHGIVRADRWVEAPLEMLEPEGR